jgi:tRNA A-37 threonylcarbamoyl transferase component Bud32/tetratricopeptide (TPR) repeat protein
LATVAGPQAWNQPTVGPALTTAAGSAVAVVGRIGDDDTMPRLPDGPVLPLPGSRGPDVTKVDHPALPMPLRDVIPHRARPATERPGEAPRRIVVEEPGEPNDEPPRPPSTRERFGRYVVLQQVGAGAMGVVLAAYDQLLDRKVALKLLRADIVDSEEGIHRMRREAQAMARLSHPNVAQVYEGGEVDGQLFLAMEFIDGVTLRSWLGERPRGWQEVLAVLVQAGHGLAAAHAAGLTHRDFKPENVIVGSDGRVRVLDFGLSRGHGSSLRPLLDITRQNFADVGVTAAGSMLGTPAYMSPEQFHGDEADARSDQFGFCVAVWEGMYGRRPFDGADVRTLRANVLNGELVPPPAGTQVPAWVRRIVERGLSTVRGERWPNMDALLAALARDPGRARRRWAAGGLAAVCVAAAGYGAAVYGNAAAQTCAVAELDDVWGAPQRAALADVVRATAAPYAEDTIVASAGHLDAYREAWTSASRGACEAHRSGAVSDSLYDRRMLCLRQRRAALAATVTVLQQTTAETVAQVVDTAAGLPPIAACTDDDRLVVDMRLPDDAELARAVEQVRERLARAQALERSGRHPEAIDALAPLQREAEALGDLPLRAEVLLLAGKLAMDTFHLDEALAPLAQAEALALESRSDEVAAEALVIWIFNAGYGAGRSAEALAAAPRAWALVRRVGSPPGLAALLHNNLGSVRTEIGDSSGCIGELKAALALLDEHAPDDPLRVVVVHNLVAEWSDRGRHELARELAEVELDRMGATHGACHPQTSLLRLGLARSQGRDGRVDTGVSLAEQSFTCFVEGSPHHALYALGTLTFLHRLDRDRPNIRRQLERATPLLARLADDPTARVAFDLVRAELALAEDHTLEAGPLLTATHERLAGREDQKENLVTVERLLSSLALREHDPAEALVHAQRAAVLLKPAATSAERASVRFAEAQAVRATGDPARAEALAVQAIDEFAAAGAGHARDIADIRAWLATP